MTAVEKLLENVSQAKLRAVARAISILEDDLPGAIELASAIEAMRPRGVVIGITGAAGVGKSSLANKLVECIKARVQRVGVLAIDPSSPRTQGAFLGDRIRMIQHATDSRVLMRSMATRGMVGGVARAARAATQVMALAGCDPILLETTGVGQVETAIKQYADIVTVVLCPGAGDEVQTLKAGLFEIADLIVVNKSDKPGADELLAWLRSSLEGTRTALFAASASRGDGVWELAADLAARESQARGAGPLRIERT